MCGRFALPLQPNHIRHHLDVHHWENDHEFIPRYNIAPRTNVPVLRTPDHGGQPILHTMKWGLVPHWSKAEDTTLSTTNARSENLVQGGGIWGPLRGTKRCAIPCQGYYEWLTKGKHKLPHFTKRKDGAIMLLAGLYDSAVIQGRTLWTFTIVTTDANKDFSWLHDRQPVILSSQTALAQWLDTSDKSWSKQLTQLVKPYHDPNVPLECYQVPKEVGKVGTENPAFIEPIAMRKDGIQAMFSKQAEIKSEQVKLEQPPSSSPQKRTVDALNDDGDPIPAKKPKRESSPKKKISQQPADVKPITTFFSKK